MEQLYPSQDTQNLYEKIKPSCCVPRTEMCRDKVVSIYTDEHEVIEWWKQHYDEHLNGAEAAHQDSKRNDFISCVNCHEVSEVTDATKLLKNNKAAGKDSIEAELINGNSLH